MNVEFVFIKVQQKFSACCVIAEIRNEQIIYTHEHTCISLNIYQVAIIFLSHCIEKEEH
jgi:hypothetical protein